MPIHDWTTVPAGLFHHFHQDWSVEIARTLNRGLLPKGVDALVEQRSGPLASDVLAIEQRMLPSPIESGEVATMPPPVTRIVRRSTMEFYAERANRVVVKHHLGRILAVIEIIPPGNKDSRAALRDLFSPTPRDSCGIHKLIWDEFVEEEFDIPPGKNRILVSYQTGEESSAYIEPIGVGDALPDMPLFLADGLHVFVPLELTYQATWHASPEGIRQAVQSGVLPTE